MAEVFCSEFVLGGQRSGKSRRAETIAMRWLSASPAHRAVTIATAQPWDDEMRERIARHQQDRAQRLPGMSTVEEPLALADAVRQHSSAHTLVVVDCLTMWLTNLLMPMQGVPADPQGPVRALCEAVAAAPGPVVLVSNEIGWGVIPMGREVRAFVDALGHANQALAAVCPRATLMAAGLPLTLKDNHA